MVKPRFAVDFPTAVIREGVEELTSRAEEVGSRRTFIDTTHVEADSAGRCGLACLLSSHLPRNRSSRMGNDVLLLLRFVPGGENEEAGGESKLKGSMGHESGKRQRKTTS